MNIFKLVGNSPEDNLLIDEELLHAVNQGAYSNGILRLWESDTHFVVLGRSKIVEDDVHTSRCIANQIPILRRCSGGGTVLQGPGCFNYAFILPMGYASELQSIHHTASFILNRVCQILSTSIQHISIEGTSDLTIQGVKFSGNAQRRIKHAVLFHGTILYNFNLSLITHYLKEPSIQPAYRKNRPHSDFIRNISIGRDDLFKLFCSSTTPF